MRHVRILLIPLILGCLLLAACGGNHGGGDWIDPGTPPAPAVTTYRVVDLATGALTGSDTLPNLLTDPAYRTTLMAFRLVPAGATVIGAEPGEVGAQGDEARSTASVGAFYLAAFECTQAQWQALTGATPWSGLTAPGATIAGPTLPAVGLSRTTADAALAAASTARGRAFRLPTDVEWERACRADTITAYAWGDSTDGSVAASAAQVRETRAAFGPQVVGSRGANAFGFFDLHGNVWELTTEAHRRGGSWAEPVILARSANRADDEAVPHPLVGVRLAMTP
jgi:formylglycine-generating enzyme required for sulfatase activity